MDLGPDVATGSKKSKRKQKAHLPEMDKKSKGPLVGPSWSVDFGFTFVAALDLLMMDPLSGKSGHDEDSEEDTLALRQKMTKKKRKKLVNFPSIESSPSHQVGASNESERNR